MSYEERFESFQDELIQECKSCISDNFNCTFDMWLQMDADHVFGDLYTRTFETHFDGFHNISSDMLYYAGKQVLYFILAYRDIHPSCTQTALMTAVETFIGKQLDDFTNDYDTAELVNTFPCDTDPTQGTHIE